MKRGIIILLLILVAVVITFYPRSFHQVMGIKEDSSIQASAIEQKEFRISPGTTVTIEDGENSKKILDFFKSYQYRRAYISYKELDGIPESFSVTFADDDGDGLRIVTAGDEYATFFHNGSSETVKVFGDKFDLSILRKLSAQD
ncbi:hypothetical protein [Sinanaerobacter chloroacetimidivorans]|uniref:Uncharacterized protein n=1 Tax=Sinanaerobacter chloroacetimidivorans TaxID=2818044 RepID=A0A8J8B2Q4_9FIRM|nr:hypothetical protein [Sinanaerobacter chloroacetimidivorans]MBR0597475.1 hypothetical protein [Sinanaerobacter chloroacetimidivorans]